MLCGYSGFLCLIECKTGRGKLNEQQRKFREGFPGALIVTNNPEEAVSKFFLEYSCALLGRALHGSNS